MTDAAKFFKDFGDLLLEKVEMNFAATIVSFSSADMTATIRPMLFTNNEAGNGQALNVPDIKNVPVERQPGVKPRYQNGDLVSVKCYASAIQQPMQGARANQRENRYQLSSCTVTSALKLKTTEANYIWFDDTAVNVSGALKVDGDIILNGQSLKTFLTVTYPAHVHTGVTPGSGASGPVGP